MPRYFFDIHDGLDVRDDVGKECSGLEAARAHAIQTLGAYVFRSEVLAGDGSAVMVIVRDSGGRHALTARLALSIEISVPHAAEAEALAAV